jgi:hypothetical protein
LTRSRESKSSSPQGVPKRLVKARNVVRWREELCRAMRYLWAFPTTTVGLLFVAPTLLSGGCIEWIDGVLELHGRAVGLFLRYVVPLPGGASAMTLGHVVLGLDRATLARTRAHERVHVRQCERWGPLFLPAYGIASLIALARRGDAYRDNAFEREAYHISS